MATMRALCDRDGLLMISDDTFTGLRSEAACAQGDYGFRPDLTILGKTIRGGTPLASLAETKEAVAQILSGAIVRAGTPNGDPLCLTTSKWSLDQLLALGVAHRRACKSLASG